MLRRENAFRVAENTDAMLAFWDKDLRCKFANSSYLKWFGKSPLEMIDKITLPELLGQLYPKNLPYITGALKGVVQVFERDITLPNGEIRSTIATYKPEIKDGVVMGFYAHVADISALKNPFEDQIGPRKLRAISPSEVVLNKVEHSLRAALFTAFPGIETLAAQHFISSTKLKRDFKERYKSTIFSYYRTLQMQVAEKYLQEKIYTKSQVAAILGFENPSNFLACYKKYESNKNRRPGSSSETSTEKLYKLFISKTPMSIAMFDKDFRLLAASERWLENYTDIRKSSIGLKMEELFPKTGAQWNDIWVRCLQAGETCRGEGPVAMEDGSQAWLRWEIKPWQRSDDEAGGIIVFTEDITEVKAQLDELKVQVQTFKNTTHFLRIGTWDKNFETQTSEWNSVTREILELPPSFEPTLVPALNFYKEGEDRERATHLLNEAFTNGTAFDAYLTLVTVLGNEKRVRVVGFSDFEKGSCRRLYGTLQEV